MSQVVPFSSRLKVNLISLGSMLFLTFYNQLVCPFLDSLPYVEELINLLVIYLFMIIIREWMFRQKQIDIETNTISKDIASLYLWSWIITGLIALIFHELRYRDIDPNQIVQIKPWVSDYPWHSHLKVLSGFWFLGAGLLVQIELVITESYVRKYLKNQNVPARIFKEFISSRITWGNFIYAFVPSVSLLILVIRYSIQDHIIPLAVMMEILYIAVVFVAVAIIAARVYGKRLKKDTQELTQALESISSGDFSTQLWPIRQDELGLIASGINSMVLGLIQRDRIKESFGYFVSPEIAERFVGEFSNKKDMRKSGEKKRVAVLMCDIRNFSGMSEEMLPSEIVEMLNDYFDHMVRAIELHGGLVDKFIGDAVMAVFGLTANEENPCHAALQAAIVMRTELKRFNSKRVAEGKVELNNGVGIHYGDVIASFMGSSKRLEFTVIGSTVNIAARLESQSKAPNPPVLLSREFAIQVKDDYPLVKVGEADLKGVGRRKIYSVKPSLLS